MKRIVGIIFLMMLVTACSGSTSPSQAPADEPLPTGLPRAEEVCLKPEDASGITVTLFKYAAHGRFQAKPGWTVAFRSSTIPGIIQFQKPVDPESVRIKVVPSSWTLERTNSVEDESQFGFRLLPEGRLTTDETKPGWVVLTLEAAKDKQGASLIERPWTLRIYAYDQSTIDRYPYLKECAGSLVVPTKGE